MNPPTDRDPLWTLLCWTSGLLAGLLLLVAIGIDSSEPSPSPSDRLVHSISSIDVHPAPIGEAHLDGERWTVRIEAADLDGLLPGDQMLLDLRANGVTYVVEYHSPEQIEQVFVVDADGRRPLADAVGSGSVLVNAVGALSPRD